MKPQPGRSNLPSSHCTEISSGVMVKKNAAMNKRTQHQRLFLSSLERHGVELEPVIDQFVAELARHLRLQPLDLLGL